MRATHASMCAGMGRASTWDTKTVQCQTEVQVKQKCLWLLVQSGCLKSPAGDLVVGPGGGAEDVALESDAELPIDRTCSNCNVVVPLTFPEQHRTALLAESSPPRIARAVPFEAACLREPELLILHRGRRHIGARLLSTLMTVARNHRPQRSRNLECDSPAEARPGLVCHGMFLLRLFGKRHARATRHRQW